MVQRAGGEKIVGGLGRRGGGLKEVGRREREVSGARETREAQEVIRSRWRKMDARSRCPEDRRAQTCGTFV